MANYESYDDFDRDPYVEGLAKRTIPEVPEIASQEVPERGRSWFEAHKLVTGLGVAALGVVGLAARGVTEHYRPLTS